MEGDVERTRCAGVATSPYQVCEGRVGSKVDQDYLREVERKYWRVVAAPADGWTWVRFEGDCAGVPGENSFVARPDLPPGWSCTAVAVPAQTAGTDGGTSDGGSPDGGVPDGGTSADAGTVDGGTGPVTLTVDPGGGVVTLSDTDEVYYKRFESAGSITVPAGTQLTLRADPFSSQQKTFSAWSGTVAGCSGTATELDLTLNASGSCNPAYAP